MSDPFPISECSIPDNLQCGCGYRLRKAQLVRKEVKTLVGEIGSHLEESCIFCGVVTFLLFTQAARKPE